MNKKQIEYSTIKNVINILAVMCAANDEKESDIMPRNMSFAITTDQFKARTKTVTRRLGWWFLKPGDLVNGVKKSMGLKKGEKIEVLSMIEIKSVRKEPLNAITQNDVILEGFPNWNPEDFIRFICDHYKVKPDVMVNRIEFKYIF